MKLNFHFVPQTLKNIKLILQIIHDLLSDQQKFPQIYFVYFIGSKNIRILIDNKNSPIVISLGANMLTNDNLCQLKEDKDILSFSFKDSKNFLRVLDQVLEKDDPNGLVFQLKRQKIQNQDFRYLRISFKDDQNFKTNLLINTPKYDLAEIKYHSWLSGCVQTFKLIEFGILLEQLQVMMGVMLKMKLQPGHRLFITFDFEEKVYECRSSDEGCGFWTIGQIRFVQKPEELKKIKYALTCQGLKIIYQVIRKFNDMKMIITKNKDMVLVFLKEDLFVSHIKASEWFILTQMTSEEKQTKIEHETLERPKYGRMTEG